MNVINKSSIINGQKIEPWLVEDSIIPILMQEGYVDNDGLLALSESQQAHFAGYKRPREFVERHFRAEDGSLIVADQINGFEIK